MRLVILEDLWKRSNALLLTLLYILAIWMFLEMLELSCL
jgi:hypothetical protein